MKLHCDSSRCVTRAQAAVEETTHYCKYKRKKKYISVQTPSETNPVKREKMLYNVLVLHLSSPQTGCRFPYVNSVGIWLCSDLQRTLGFIHCLCSGEEIPQRATNMSEVRGGVQANAKKSMGSSYSVVWF